MELEERAKKRASSAVNRMEEADEPIHDWYRFVLAFPPHLVRDYLLRFGVDATQTVLDPFCGVGTTLVECKKLGISSIGVEANPIAHFASRVKVDWSPDPDGIIHQATKIAEIALAVLREDGIEDVAALHTNGQATKPLRTLDAARQNLLIANSISPLPLHKTLVLLDAIQQGHDARYQNHLLLALARELVFSISNLHFRPEVGVGTLKLDAPVISVWLKSVQRMAQDLLLVQAKQTGNAEVYLADSRRLSDTLKPNSVDVVITSPPYPNEKDYTRTTRLEAVLLGFLTTKQDLQRLKRTLIRSNTRNVYKGDEDHLWIEGYDEVQGIANAIESRRIELGKTSGFEKLYATVTRLYFGGLMEHLLELRPVLRRGARLAYVVGDQASYLRVMIRTGNLLATIAETLGYEIVGVDLFRTRFATVTKEQMREEVVILRWPGFQPSLWQGATMSSQNRYTQIMERIFFDYYVEGSREVEFERSDMERVAQEMGIKLPKNLGDVVYSFRYRTTLPPSIREKAPEGEIWIIRPAGRAKYKFVSVVDRPITPNPVLSETKIPDATPGLVAKYSLNDEQALLAKVRYNRLIDVFTGVTCYSLQNHLRTTVAELGQVETDEIYVGVDRRGVHYVFPIQAKGGTDRLNIVQIEQDFAVCVQKFPDLVCRAIAAQFMQGDLIALFEFEMGEGGVTLASERHYRLVLPEEVTPSDLRLYTQRPLTD